MRRYSIAQAVIQRPRHQHPSCSLRHSICLHPSIIDASPSSCSVSPVLHTSLLPLKHMRQHFWAQRASIQHPSSGNSAAAAPTPTLLSATKQWPASKHDAASPSCCLVFPKLRAPHRPRNRCATISAPTAHRYSIPQAAIQRPRHQRSRCSLRQSNGLHPSMMPHRQAAA